MGYAVIKKIAPKLKSKISGHARVYYYKGVGDNSRMINQMKALLDRQKLVFKTIDEGDQVRFEWTIKKETHYGFHLVKSRRK
jgi:hypothetical protein